MRRREKVSNYLLKNKTAIMVLFIGLWLGQSLFFFTVFNFTGIGQVAAHNSPLSVIIKTIARKSRPAVDEQEGCEKLVYDSEDQDELFREINSELEKMYQEFRELNEETKNRKIALVDSRDGRLKTTLFPISNSYPYIEPEIRSIKAQGQKMFFYSRPDASLYQYDKVIGQKKKLISLSDVTKQAEGCDFRVDFEDNLSFEIVDDRIYAWRRPIKSNDYETNGNSCILPIYYADLGEDSMEWKLSKLSTEVKGSVTDILSITHHENYAYLLISSFISSPQYEHYPTYQKVEDESLHTAVVKIDLETSESTILSKYKYESYSSDKISNGNELPKYTTQASIGIAKSEGIVYDYFADFGYYCDSNCVYDQKGYYNPIYLSIKRKNLTTGSVEIIKEWDRDDFIYEVGVTDEELYFMERERYVILSLEGEEVAEAKRKHKICEIKTRGSEDSDHLFGCYIDPHGYLRWVDYDYKNDIFIEQEVTGDHLDDMILRANKRIQQYDSTYKLAIVD